MSTTRMSVVGVETGESLTAMELSELTHAEAAIERPDVASIPEAV